MPGTELVGPRLTAIELRLAQLLLFERGLLCRLKRVPTPTASQRLPAKTLLLRWHPARALYVRV